MRRLFTTSRPQNSSKTGAKPTYLSGLRLTFLIQQDSSDRSVRISAGLLLFQEASNLQYFLSGNLPYKLLSLRIQYPNDRSAQVSIHGDLQ